MCRITVLFESMMCIIMLFPDNWGELIESELV